MREISRFVILYPTMPVHFPFQNITRWSSKIYINYRFMNTDLRAMSTSEAESTDTLKSSTTLKRNSHRPMKLIHRQSVGSFVDFKRIKIIAGNGGDGGVSFRKLYKEPMGPPNGGTGGKGGDVYIRASKECSSLSGTLGFYQGGNGQNGRGKDLNGAKGRDVEILVPVGTWVRVIQDLNSQNEPESYNHNHMDEDDVLESDQASFIDNSKLSPSQQSRDYNMNLEDEQKYVEDEDFEVQQKLFKKKYEERYMDQNLEDDMYYEDEEVEERLSQLVNKYYIIKGSNYPMIDRLRMLASRIPPEPPKSSVTDFEMLKHDESRLIARGGRGGLGNTHFQSTDIRGPTFALRGGKGESFLLELELKTLADAGLVGLPNAGKSTFLSAVSKAHPKIAPYPFTTLNPYVGTIDYPDFFTLTLADIPGLVPGAHKNIGLGHAFLRHVERSRILVYVIDLSSPNALQDFEILRFELEAYKNGMTKKPSMIIGNKADLGPGLCKKNLDMFIRQVQIPIIPISALEGKNIVNATAMMRQLLETF